MARTAFGQQGISALTRCDVVTLVRREESNASSAHASGIGTFEPAPMAEAAAGVLPYHVRDRWFANGEHT